MLTETILEMGHCFTKVTEEQTQYFSSCSLSLKMVSRCGVFLYSLNIFSEKLTYGMNNTGMITLKVIIGKDKYDI